MPALPLSCVGGSPDQGWVSAAQFHLLFWLPLLLVALEVYRAGKGSPGGLALNFSCVCACVSFPAPGLTLRLWRVVTMVHLTSSGPGAGPSRTCSHPAPCQPPSPTASLALRASLCSGMCALALPACLPQPPFRSWVTAVSAHAPPSTLASRLSSLALCLPVCLWSVLSVSLTLPSDLSWVSTSPSAVPTPSGVPALPILSPSLGAPPFFILTLPSLPASQAGLVLTQLPHLHRGLQSSCLFPSGSALCSISCSKTSSNPSYPLLTFPSPLPLGLYFPKLQGVHLSAIS